jgi:hypothetical protein
MVLLDAGTRKINEPLLTSEAIGLQRFPPIMMLKNTTLHLPIAVDFDAAKFFQNRE